MTKERASEKEIEKKGPPIRPNGREEKTTDVDLDLDKARLAAKSKEAILRSKALPYVDIPPNKANLRPVNTPVKENQMSKLGPVAPVYKSRAPVEIGIDIEKIVETVLDLEISVPLRSLAGVSG